MKNREIRSHTSISVSFRERIFLLIIFLIFVSSSVDDLSADDISAMKVIHAFLQGKETDTVTIDKDRVIQDLKNTFGLQDEDLAFIFSVRAARLPMDGFDFFKHPTSLVQFASLYKEAKEKWGKPITEDFYDFFGKYSEERVGMSNWAERWFQLEHAKKRFKLPY